MIPILVVAGGVAAAGAVAGQVARRRMAARYPAPGRMIDIGGYRLHLLCEGETMGGPTVVLEGGLGDPGISWAAVMPGVAQLTGVCVVDRAGSGWSDASPRPRSVEVIVDELRAALAAAQVPGPYVLVGQSFGGLVARLFALRHREEVAGLVLVDATPEDYIERAPESVRLTWERMNRLAGPMFALPRALSAAGVFALRPSLVPGLTGGDIPPEVGLDRYRALIALGGGLKAMTATMKLMDASRAQVREARMAAGERPLGDLPLVVLTAGEQADLPGGIPPEDQSANHELWRQLHRELAAESSAGRWEVVEGSGHMIHHARPDAVVAAIREVVETARGRG
ncbi:MAG TPA: alpha/beta hydrolase [Candidatus Limnocylindria bacterium]